MMNNKCRSACGNHMLNGIYATLITISLRATFVFTTKVIISLRTTFVATILYIGIYFTMNVVRTNT